MMSLLKCTIWQNNMRFMKNILSYVPLYKIPQGILNFPY